MEVYELINSLVLEFYIGLRLKDINKLLFYSSE